MHRMISGSRRSGTDDQLDKFPLSFRIRYNNLSEFLLTLHYFRVGEQRAQEQLLRVSVDKSVDYVSQFADVFKRFLKSHRVVEVTTSPDGMKNCVAWIIQFAAEASPPAFLREVRVTAQDDQVQLLSGEDHVTI